ncbi:hypothetical protein GGI21_004470, partial [Coemansia aciculifera]
ASRPFVVINNIKDANFEEQLSSPEWSRMMSERDDVRGRRSDYRLFNGEVGLVNELEKCRETLINMAPPSLVEFNYACAPSNPHAALAQCSVLGNLSAVALGHLDSLLKPVQDYLGVEGGIKFVDLGSKQAGFSQYILWRANQRKATGWYFGCEGGGGGGSSSGSGSELGLDIERLSLACRNDAHSLEEYGSGVAAGVKPDILDPSSVESFVDHVKSKTKGSGIDLVVAECGSTDTLGLPDFGTDLERRQYTYIIAQAVIALRLLRKGGTFVFKMSDTATPLGAELLFLLHACFTRIAVVRSMASRPTSTERFVVCNLLKGESRWVASHLLAALTKIHGDREHFRLSHVVSWTKVSSDRQFMEQLSRFNVSLARGQLAALQGAVALGSFSSSPSGNSYQPSAAQVEVARQCLKSWDLLAKP